MSKKQSQGALDDVGADAASLSRQGMDVSRRGLDCHAAGVPGAKFNFEMSDQKSWEKELNSKDADRIELAHKWAKRVRESAH